MHISCRSICCLLTENIKIWLKFPRFSITFNKKFVLNSLKEKKTTVLPGLDWIHPIISFVSRVVHGVSQLKKKRKMLFTVADLCNQEANIHGDF